MNNKTNDLTENLSCHFKIHIDKVNPFAKKQA